MLGSSVYPKSFKQQTGLLGQVVWELESIQKLVPHRAGQY